jgi:hypothetical protein
MAVGLDAHLRSTSYRAGRAAGWLNALSLGADPLGLVRVEINGGWRNQHLVDTTTTVAPIALPNAQWIGASVDVSLGRSWYVLFSGTRDGTGVDLTNQLYASLVYRF